MAYEHVFSRMVHDNLLRRARRCFDDRRNRLASLRTSADAKRYCEHVRRVFRASFTPLPKRNALNPRITRTLHANGCVIEMVRYESRPKFWVTANLYRPAQTASSRSRPALLVSCGHDPCGKTTPDYQLFTSAMARAGWVVLVYDPIGQGERRQYVAPGRTHDAVEEHIILGNQQTLIGEFLGTWLAWDGIRSLDYLLSRDEVDPTRIAMTGCSGGGTMTAFISMLDQRITMIAPSCFGSTWESSMLAESPGDSEQNPPGAVGHGIELADAFIARAPRPTLLLAQEYDIFDIRSVREIHQQISHVYTLLGRRDHAQLHVGNGGHGMPADHRFAMYEAFTHWAGMKATIEERTSDRLDDLDLQVTRTGLLADEPGTWLGFNFVKAKANELRKTRGRMTNPQLCQSIGSALRLPARRGNVPTWRSFKVWHSKDTAPWTRAWRYAVETEPEVFALLHYYSNRDIVHDSHNYAAPPAPADLVVYVPHLSSRQDMQAGESPVSASKMYAVDVRGFGESRNLTCYGNDDFFLMYDADFFAASIEAMLGGCYLGRRVFDLLRSLDLLSSRGATRIHLVGRGLGSVIVAIAGCLHPAVNRVTLRHGLRSFHDLTRIPEPKWPLSVRPQGVLKKFDLPDCYRILRNSKALRMLETWNAHMQTTDKDR